MSDDYRALRKLRALQVAPRKSEVLRLAQKRAAFYGGITNSSSSSSSSFHDIAPAQRAHGDDSEEAGERRRPSGRITPSGMSVHVHGSHLGNAESMKSLPSDSQLAGGSKVKQGQCLQLMLPRGLGHGGMRGSGCLQAFGGILAHY